MHAEKGIVKTEAIRTINALIPVAILLGAVYAAYSFLRHHNSSGRSK
jgi:hypothetical protein